MTPREKAEELVKKYLDLGWRCEAAEECAIIAVDEMINTFESLFMTEGSALHQYLLDVKKELHDME